MLVPSLSVYATHHKADQIQHHHTPQLCRLRLAQHTHAWSWCISRIAESYEHMTMNG